MELQDKNTTELNYFLDTFVDIFSLANECFEYSYYLNDPSTPHEFDMIHTSHSFSIFRISTARTAMIEMSKLYGKKGDKFNFYSFLNALVNGEYGNNYKMDKDLIEWKRYFDEIKPAVSRLHDWRDKAFAHTDHKHERDLLETVGYDDLKFLINVTYEFLLFIFQKVRNSTISISGNVDELKHKISLIMRSHYGHDIKYPLFDKITPFPYK